MVLGPIGLSADANWPMVNHDTNNSRHNQDVNISWSDLQNGFVQLQWSAQGAAVQAAPIVVDGRVYYGDSAGNLWAYTTNGTLVNQFTFPNAAYGETSGAPLTLVNGIIYATSVTAGDAPVGGLRLYAFDTSVDPNNPFISYTPFNGGQAVDVYPGFTGTQGGILSGAVVVDNTVIVSTSSSTFEENVVKVPTFRGGFHAFNATTGAFVWHTPVSPSGSGFGPSGGAWSTASVDEDLHLIFAGTTNAMLPPASPLTDAIVAIDYRTGEVEWHQQYTKNDVFSFQYACGFNYDVGASPQLFQIEKNGKQIDVVGTGSKEGFYRVFKRKNGKPVWVSRMLPKDEVPSVNGNPSSAYHNGFVYTITNGDESGISFNSLTVLAQVMASLGDFSGVQLLQTYAATTDQTYIRKVRADTGEVLWTNKRVTASLASITHANGVIYTANGLGLIRAIRASTGEEVEIANVGNTIGAPITIVGNQLFVGVGIFPTGGLYVYHKP